MSASSSQGKVQCTLCKWALLKVSLFNACLSSVSFQLSPVSAIWAIKHQLHYLRRRRNECRARFHNEENSEENDDFGWVFRWFWGTTCVAFKFNLDLTAHTVWWVFLSFLESHLKTANTTITSLHVFSLSHVVCLVSYFINRFLPLCPSKWI